MTPPATGDDGGAASLYKIERPAVVASRRFRHNRLCLAAPALGAGILSPELPPLGTVRPSTRAALITRQTPGSAGPANQVAEDYSPALTISTECESIMTLQTVYIT